MANPSALQPGNGAEPEAPISGKGKKPQQKINGASVTSSATPEDKGELSNAEKKRLQKEEKAARRAKEKQTNPDAASEIPKSTTSVEAKSDKGKGPASGPVRSKTSEEPQRRRRESVAVQSTATAKLASRPAAAEKSRPSKSVAFFTHLYGQPRKRTLEGTAKEVHPAISQLALLFSSYTLCGSHCRGVAMLLAMKSVSSTRVDDSLC